MVKLSFTELQEINAGIALSLPKKQENQFLTPAKDTEGEEPALIKSARESNRLLEILNHAISKKKKKKKRRVS